MKIPSSKKKKFFLKIRIFFQNWEKSHLNSIRNGAKFRPLRTHHKNSIWFPLCFGIETQSHSHKGYHGLGNFENCIFIVVKMQFRRELQPAVLIFLTLFCNFTTKGRSPHWHILLTLAYWVILHVFWSSADFFQNQLFSKFFQEYRHSGKHFGSRSDPAFCRGLIWV